MPAGEERGYTWWLFWSVTRPGGAVGWKMKTKKWTRVKIAVFQDEQYHPGLEQHLVAEGYFAVVVRDPDPSEIDKYRDYLLAPEWIRWIMPTPPSIEAWIESRSGSHDRYKLRKKLKASERQRGRVRADIAPLTAEDYSTWYKRLYFPEIGGRKGGVLFWPEPGNLAQKVTLTAEGVVENFLRIFLHGPDGDLIGGELWAVNADENSLTIRAAAFERKAQTDYELAIRALEELRICAMSRGLNWLSYGTDPNLFGVDTGIGLQRFKATLGMKPVLARYGTFHLLKILNRDLSLIRNGEDYQPAVLVFALDDDRGQGRSAAFRHVPPRRIRGDLEMQWNLDLGLTPFRLVTDRHCPAVNVPDGMVLRDIIIQPETGERSAEETVVQVGIPPQPRGEESREKRSGGAVKGLRPFELQDLELYKDALNQVDRICWNQYFPYLYFRYDSLLLAEEEGSLCIFHRQDRTARSPRLSLYFLPMPLNEKALRQCLARVRDFNHSKKAEIRRVDEQDLALLQSLGAAVRTFPLDLEYVYAPDRYASLSGRHFQKLRQDINRTTALGNVEVRDFVAADSRECLSLMDDWAALQHDKYGGQAAPRGFARRCVRRSDLFDAKDLFGLVVLVDGKIRSVGFAGEIRRGLANIFITYSDHTFPGMNRYLFKNLILRLGEYGLANYAGATTPGLEFAKESLRPVLKHRTYRVHITG